MPEWFIPLASLIGGIFGAWVGVKVNIVRLETQMQGVLKSLGSAKRRLSRHNDTLLVHDIEIESVLTKLEMPRVRRQNVQT